MIPIYFLPVICVFLVHLLNKVIAQVHMPSILSFIFYNLMHHKIFFLIFLPSYNLLISSFHLTIIMYTPSLLLSLISKLLILHHTIKGGFTNHTNVYFYNNHNLRIRNFEMLLTFNALVLFLCVFLCNRFFV